MAARSIVPGVLLMLVPLAGALAQRAEVRGQVVDANQRPVPFANVVVQKQGRYVADDSGRFSVHTPTGSVVMDVRRLGYQPATATLRITRDTVVEFVMLPVARDLPVQRIVATAVDGLTRRGFYDRMRDADRGLTTGYFITPEDIEARRPFKASQMLERVPGVKLLGTGGSNQVPVGANDCAMTVYLDGARVPMANQDPTKGSEGMSMQRLRENRKASKVLPGESFDGIIGANSLAGIEIYPRGTRAPAQYQQLNGTCGIIVVWTK